ncbi:MAG TPA: hypothetical protein VLV54_01460 [Thermoanaerobaculia bacterium]|nr:hypothetical protein [Thermoanaerobaculia bacterium]
MSSAVEIKTKPASNPDEITRINGTGGTTPDSGGDAPPDPDPGPIKG